MFGRRAPPAKAAALDRSRSPCCDPRMRSSWHTMKVIATSCIGVAGCQGINLPPSQDHSAAGGGTDAGPAACLRHPPERPDGAVSGVDELVLAIMWFSL